MKIDIVEYLSSSRLALALLVAILFACLVGVVFIPFPLSKELVFHSIWFNSMLFLLVVNLVFCVFRRIRRQRRLTLAAVGSAVFHLSMVTLCAGAIFDSLFFFKARSGLPKARCLTQL